MLHSYYWLKKHFPGITMCITLACPASGLAMGLLPKDDGRAVWEALEGQVLAKLGGSCVPVKQPTERLAAASMPATKHGKLAFNKVVTAVLSPMTTIKYVISPEKIQGKPDNMGGLLEVIVPTTGTYLLGSVSQAWIDLAAHDERTIAKAKLYQWVDFCDRRMKTGLFELQAGARHWIQISASPVATIDLFFAGPLN